MNNHRSFVKSLLKGPNADLVVRFLELADAAPDTWPDLPGPLRRELQTFERRQLAAAYAGVLGAPEDRVARRQEFLLRTAVTSILFPLEAMEDRLLVMLEQRGLPALFHHAIRELCDETDRTDAVFAAGDAARMAVFQLEDAMRDEAATPEILVEELVGAVRSMQFLLADAEIPYGKVGIALLWVTAMYGLGTLNDDPTATEYYAEW